jgi:RNA polymerase sigma factor (sigma-70 family)
MVGADPASRPAKRTNARWPDTPTRWTVVLAAREHDSPKGQAALEELCRAYWYPLYAFARRLGHKHEDAQDLVQGFLARLLEKRDLRFVAREKGTFRSFLMAGIKHFAINEWKKSQADKRGGGQTVLSLDFTEGEAAYALVAADTMTPERQGARSWALEILKNALNRMREEFAKAGKSSQFEAFKELLAYETASANYAELAKLTGLTEGSVPVVLSRMRKRYHQMVRDEIAQTMENPTEAEIKEELRQLLAALSD